MMNIKVMVYCPVAPKTPKVYARTIAGLFGMHWYEPLDIVFGRHDQDKLPDHDQAYSNITAKYNHARDLALAGGYDALLTVESDMILPPMTLERLARVNADVAYGLYVSRHGKHQWLAYHHLGDERAKYTGTSYSATPDECEAGWGSVVESAGVGLGCTLIRRPVLEAIEFRCPDTKVANDWFFALDCKERGFTQKHDLGVVCGHIEGAPNPKIYWPEPNGGYRIEFLPEAPPERVAPQDGKIVLNIDRIGTRILMCETA